MAADIKTVLKRLLEELDAEDEKELIEALKGKKLTADELLAAIRELPPESKKEVREALADVQEEIEEEDKTKPKTKKKEEETEEEEKEKPKNKKARTRPGRKSGRAYDWWVDEEGEVVRLDIARIYSGEDEPDEIEMFPKDEDEDDDDEDDGKTAEDEDDEDVA